LKKCSLCISKIKTAKRNRPGEGGSFLFKEMVLRLTMKFLANVLQLHTDFLNHQPIFSGRVFRKCFMIEGLGGAASIDFFCRNLLAAWLCFTIVDSHQAKAFTIEWVAKFLGIPD
jgi:hypothetical protein